ncbi:hypothetical protein CEXT_248741 [Caerostris extrusa]|uniref:Uncharacterized protein n=1 Tax=Caerostris extrusa TaxID=172846 RepID=A0AAV4RUZ9_CAEEX|nr:hypothetical protein CEXT_248741 [Caerostris extrusa]
MFYTERISIAAPPRGRLIVYRIRTSRQVLALLLMMCYLFWYYPKRRFRKMEKSLNKVPQLHLEEAGWQSNALPLNLKRRVGYQRHSTPNEA